jgi:hypothetical protein
MVAPSWIYGILLSAYIVLMASDDIRSYECKPSNIMHPTLVAPVVALTNLLLTIGVIIVYSISIYKSIKTGKYFEKINKLTNQASPEMKLRKIISVARFSRWLSLHVYLC